MIDLPSPLDKTFAHSQELPSFFNNLVRDVNKILGSDRCYLYLRDPELLLYQVTHCYCTDPSIADLTQAEPTTEPYYIFEQDPFFAAALEKKSNIYVDDIQNLILQEQAKEQDSSWSSNYLEHKALIQAHLVIEEQLWGIIRVEQFQKLRPWTKFDRDLINLIGDRITPLATVYVRKEIRNTLQQYNDGHQIGSM